MNIVNLLTTSRPYSPTIVLMRAKSPVNTMGQARHKQRPEVLPHDPEKLMD